MMDRSELERIWATTAKHLNAARAQLPEVLAPGLDGAPVSGFDEWMNVCGTTKWSWRSMNLKTWGLRMHRPGDFWRHLILAAENMELWERAADFKRKMGNA